MQVTETLSEGLKREFKVVIEAQEIDEKITTRLRELSTQVKIPGFRPGKAPMQVMRQRYGQAVLGEVLERAVNDGSQQALQENELRPAQRPEIEVTSFEKEQDLEFTMKMEVLPKIEPGDFSKVKVETLKVEVPDSEVDEALKRIAENNRDLKDVEEPRAAKEGEVLVIDFKGSVDGETLPGMEAEGQYLELGSGRFIPGFEDQLVGAKPGEDKTVTVTFPEDYGNTDLAGKEAVFEVKVKELKVPETPAIDDDFAKKLNLDDLEALKARVREQLEADYGKLTRQRLKRQVLDELAAMHDFPVPETMVEAEFHAIWQQIEQDKERGTLDPEDAEKDDETLKADYRKIAERRVRLGLLLSEVGQRSEIEVTQDELNRALIEEVQRYPGQERQVFEFYQKNQQALANLRAPIFEDKVIDHIVEQAETTERALSPDDLRKELEAESETAGEGGADAKKTPAKKTEKKAKAEKGKSAEGEKAAEDKTAAEKPAKKTASKSSSKSSTAKSSASKSSGTKSAAKKG